MLAKLPEDRQNLLNLADYLEEHGWCQGRMELPDGSRCLIGGSLKFTGMGEGLMRFARFSGFKKDPSKLGDYIINWNDDQRRTKEEVLSTLRAAALDGL